MTANEPTADDYEERATEVAGGVRLEEILASDPMPGWELVSYEEQGGRVTMLHWRKLRTGGEP